MKKNYLFIVIVVLLMLPTIFPLFRSGFFPFHDDTQVVRVYEMAQSLKDGMFPVRWVSDLGYGYGYPIFNFYAPLAYYIGGLFVLFGFSSLVATKVMIAIPMILSGVFMYLFLKKITSSQLAVLGSVLYSYFPYHAVNLYVRGDVGELYAYALYPLISLSILLVYRIKDYSFKKLLPSIILFGTSFSALSISHNLSALMASIFIFLSGIAMIVLCSNKKKVIVFYVLGLTLAFALSSFYIIPALFEMNYTNVLSQVGRGAHFADHFVCINQLVDSPWGFGGSVKGCVDGLSFRLGKSNILLFAVSIIVFIVFYKRLKERSIVGMSLIYVGISVLLLLPISMLAWNLPFMPFLQYPWRFLSFVALFSTIVVTLALQEVLDKKKTLLFFTFAIIIVTLYLNAKLFVPQSYNTLRSDDYTSKEAIVDKVSRISDEYLPSNFDKSNPPARDLLSSSSVHRTLINKSQYKKTSLVLDSSERVVFNLSYFPAWNSYVNDVKVNSFNSHGRVAIDVPSGKNIIEFKFEQTGAEKIANLISFMGIIFLIILGIISRKGFK